MSGKLSLFREKQLLCFKRILGKYREAGHFGYFSLPWLNIAFMLLIPALKKKFLRILFRFAEFLFKYY